MLLSSTTNLLQSIVRPLLSSSIQRFSTSQCCYELRKLSRVNIVDNSKIGREMEAEGKHCKIIHVYNKREVAEIGDKVLVTVKHEKKKAYVVGCKQKQKYMVPRFDRNNVVLLDEMGAPIGTRIKVPLPSMLRGRKGEFTKILSLTKKFV